ncbi:MAG: hypothetical protein WBG38_03915 [Nodosilinea sp.]
MKHPSALGVALLALVAVTTAVGPSSAYSNQSFGLTYETLSSALAKASATDVMESYQRQTDTITLERASLGEPYLLSVSVPDGATLKGYIEIDGHARIPLNSSSKHLDVSPYLNETVTQVAIVGSREPAAAAVAIAFSGPKTMVQQQAAGTGQINYQLNLLVK